MARGTSDGSRRFAAIGAAVALALALVAASSPPGGATLGRLINVPADVPTLRLAIDHAQPGGVILLAAGTS